MTRRKSKTRKKKSGNKNNSTRQSRVSDYLARREQAQQNTANTDDTTNPPQQAVKPTGTSTRSSRRHTRHNPRNQDILEDDNSKDSDSSEVQYVGSKQPSPRPERESEEGVEVESNSEGQSESDQDDENMEIEEEESEAEDNQSTDDDERNSSNNHTDSEEEEAEEEEEEVSENEEELKEEQENADTDEEQEWQDTDNVASAQDAENAKSKGQVRFDQSFASEVTENAVKPTTEIQFKQRRLIVTVNIPEVDNNVDRLSHLVTEMNEFLKFARKNNTKFRLRPFATLTAPDQNQKNQWRTRMIDNDSTDFRTYCQGYYPFSAPRGGSYRLRINAVMDKKVSLPNLIENITHDWGHKDNRAVTDIKAQNVYDPVKIGYLMRATKYITHSHELVQAMEEEANRVGSEVFFGISWGTIPSPVGGYDKDTAVQAVLIETNRDTSQDAVKLMKKWYPLNPKKKASPPFPGNFRFVINRDHPSVKGNSIAISNLSVLMERQGIFNQYAQAEQSFSIKALDNRIPDTNYSLRQLLLGITSKTSGPTYKDKPIFMSISKSINSRTGQKSSWFTFHKSVADEAVSIVKNLPLFLKSEWKMDPEDYCYAQFLSDRDQWDPVHRVANNEDTEELALATKDYTMDLHEARPDKNIEQLEEASMTSKAAREMRRMMGEDAETVVSITKERQRKQSKQSRPIDTAIHIDTQSLGSISGISATSTKMSAVRDKLQKEFADKFKSQESQINQLLEDKTEREQQNSMLKQQMDQMTVLLKSLQANILSGSQTQIPQRQLGKTQEEESQNSGEPSTPPTTEEQQKNTNPDLISDEATQIPMASPSPTKDVSKFPVEGTLVTQDTHLVDAQARNNDALKQPQGADEDFPQPDDDNEFQIFQQQQQRKEKDAITRGEEFTPDKWYGSIPADIPLPPSASSTESYLPLIRSVSPRKRLVLTDSDDLDVDPQNQTFHSHNSDRYKKRTHATGSQPGVQN